MSERGAAVIEFALALPLLLIIVSFVVDGSRMFQQHLILGGIAREVARFGSGLPELESGNYDTTNPPADTERSALVFERAAVLYDFNNVYGDLPGAGYDLTTSLADTTGNTPDLGEVFTVGVSVNYRLLVGYIAILGGETFSYPVGVVAQVPRLE